jgi:hypothetical protein
LEPFEGLNSIEAKKTLHAKLTITNAPRRKPIWPD